MDIDEIKELWINNTNNPHPANNKTDELIKKLISQNIHRRIRSLWLSESIGILVLCFILILVLTMLPKLPMTSLYISSYSILVATTCFYIVWQIIRYRTIAQLHQNKIPLNERCQQLQRFVKLLTFENKTMLPIMIIYLFSFSIVFFKTHKQQDFLEALYYSWTLRLIVICIFIISYAAQRVFNNYCKTALNRIEEELKELN